MDKRHVLEEDHQRQGLKEFNNLQSMKERVDWESFRPLLEEVFGPPRNRGPGHRSLGLSHYLLFHTVRGDEWYH